jgi:matrixin
MTLTLPRLLVCALLALVLLPAAAQADISFPELPVPASDALTSTAHGLAVARWGGDPCGGQVTLAWAHMGAGINARSQWMSTDVHNPATYTQCSISYNLDVDWDWPKLCTVIEHELGHLAGHEHVDDPHDVMSPYYVYAAPECAAGQAAASAAPAPATTAEAPATTTTRKATKKKATKRKVVKRKAKATTRSANAKARSARAARAKKSSAKKSRRGRARAAFVDGSRDGLTPFWPAAAPGL